MEKDNDDHNAKTPPSSFPIIHFSSWRRLNKAFTNKGMSHSYAEFNTLQWNSPSRGNAQSAMSYFSYFFFYSPYPHPPSVEVNSNDLSISRSGKSSRVRAIDSGAECTFGMTARKGRAYFPAHCLQSVRKFCTAVQACLQERAVCTKTILPGLTMGVGCSRWYLKEKERKNEFFFFSHLC